MRMARAEAEVTVACIPPRRRLRPLPWLLLLPSSGAFVTRSSALKGRRWRPDAEATMIEPSRPGTMSGGVLGTSVLSRLPSRATTLLLRELSIGPPKSVDH